MPASGVLAEFKCRFKYTRIWWLFYRKFARDRADDFAFVRTK